MHCGRAGGHYDGISGGAGAAHVHAVSGFGANLGGGDGSIPELGGGPFLRNLSGIAGVATGSDRSVEVRLMAVMTLAQARENFLAAMGTLRSSKVRSALTVLGIVIGVSSVISMAAIIQGLNKFVQDKVESLGSRTYFLSRFPPGTDPSRWPESIRTRRYLQYDYADFVRGAEPQYIEAIPLFAIERGRFISTFDQEHARPVVVLGAAISESLFPNTDALGKTVRINGSVYEVIGVFEHDQGLFFGPGVDIFAVISLSNFKKRYPEAKELIMAFTVPENVNIETAHGEVIQALRRLRRISAGKENDFELSSPDFLSNLWNQLTGALVILTTVISSIGLLVGGIGVMNIMLISVTERTQEIGVRKAIGARRADVRLQFLLEAVVLTLVGGTIGILIGAGVSTMVRTLVP